MILPFRKKIRIRVAGLVSVNSELLLVSHTKDNNTYYLVPGGGIDYGETAAEALVREMKEELSLDVQVKELLFVCDAIEPAGGRHLLNLFFECAIIGGSPSLGNDPRVSGFDFFSASQIETMKIHPPVARQLVDFINGRKFAIYQGDLWKD